MRQSRDTLSDRDPGWVIVHHKNRIRIRDGHQWHQVQRDSAQHPWEEEATATSLVAALIRICRCTTTTDVSVAYDGELELGAAFRDKVSRRFEDLHSPVETLRLTLLDGKRPPTADPYEWKRPPVRIARVRPAPAKAPNVDGSKASSMFVAPLSGDPVPVSVFDDIPAGFDRLLWSRYSGSARLDALAAEVLKHVPVPPSSRATFQIAELCHRHSLVEAVELYDRLRAHYGRHVLVPMLGFEHGDLRTKSLLLEPSVVSIPSPSLAWYRNVTNLTYTRVCMAHVTSVSSRIGTLALDCMRSTAGVFGVLPFCRELVYRSGGRRFCLALGDVLRVVFALRAEGIVPVEMPKLQRWTIPSSLNARRTA